MTRKINNDDLLVTPIYWKILGAINDGKRCIVMPGSARSSKTWSILQAIIQTIIWSKKPLKAAVIRYRLTWIKESVLPDFMTIMSSPHPDGFGIWDERCYNKTDRVYTFPNGSTLKFLALADDAGRRMAHGLTTDILYFNECIDLTWEPVKQLQIRNSGFRIYDFNPGINERHWIYEHIIKREDAVVIHSTFRDNPFCPENQRREIEGFEPTPENIKRGTADEVSWKIYGLGIRAQIKGLIYPDFTVIENLPKSLNNTAYGLDFGFTNHPTALILKGEIEDNLYVDELLYSPELVNLKSIYKDKQKSIEGEFEKLKIDRRLDMWADSAEPKAIQDLTNAGYNTKKAKKQGINYSILDGINAVKRFNLYITERSIHLIKELENYKWRENSNTDSCLNEPIDNWNHALDALRYAVVMSESYNGSYRPSCQMETFKCGSGSERFDTWNISTPNYDDDDDNRQHINFDSL